MKKIIKIIIIPIAIIRIVFSKLFSIFANGLEIENIYITFKKAIVPDNPEELLESLC